MNVECNFPYGYFLFTILTLPPRYYFSGPGPLTFFLFFEWQNNLCVFKPFFIVHLSEPLAHIIKKYFLMFLSIFHQFWTCKDMCKQVKIHNRCHISGNDCCIFRPKKANFWGNKTVNQHSGANLRKLCFLQNFAANFLPF